ncbi:MAG: hypothetical protein KKF30_10865 [Proteobacteria bacterium]|nr:hypothetical protein [Pseudomonadota bacterium]MBU4470842.1 hypothetical protein [Pseudomonadota bacterium]MCG2753762.1 hypothetical protein [Desulfobacteraceae bacterium]
MFSFLQEGGGFMYIIFGVSIVGFAVFCERAGFLYFKLQLNMDKVFKKISIHLENSNYRGAIDECTKIEKLTWSS